MEKMNRKAQAAMEFLMRRNRKISAPKNSRGQAAMEFLMTYGWAILVVLAAIAALAYFGVLTPDRFLPEKCTISPGISCIDFKVSSDETILVLTNSLGKDVIINSIAVGTCSHSFNQTFDNGQQSEFVIIGCENGNKGINFKGEIIIDYTSIGTDFTKSTSGSLLARIQ